MSYDPINLTVESLLHPHRLRKAPQEVSVSVPKHENNCLYIQATINDEEDMAPIAKNEIYVEIKAVLQEVRSITDIEELEAYIKEIHNHILSGIKELEISEHKKVAELHRYTQMLETLYRGNLGN